MTQQIKIICIKAKKRVSYKFFLIIYLKDSSRKTYKMNQNKSKILITKIYYLDLIKKAVISSNQWKA